MSEALEQLEIGEYQIDIDGILSFMPILADWDGSKWQVEWLLTEDLRTRRIWYFDKSGSRHLIPLELIT